MHKCFQIGKDKKQIFEVFEKAPKWELYGKYTDYTMNVHKCWSNLGGGSLFRPLEV